MVDMKIVIDDPEIGTYLQQVAEASGRPVEEIMRLAMRETMQRLRANAPRKIDEEAVRRIQDEVAGMPILDTRSADEIVGYNEFGHFD